MIHEQNSNWTTDFVGQSKVAFIHDYRGLLAVFEWSGNTRGGRLVDGRWEAIEVIETGKAGGGIVDRKSLDCIDNEF